MGEFEPVIVKKHQRRFDGFDDTILSLYSRGLSVREIKGDLEEIYGVKVSPDLISSATEAVSDLVRQWQSRPLETVYPIVYLDALRVKVRVDGIVQNRSHLSGDWRESCGQKRVARTLDSQIGRRKILVGGFNRITKSRNQRYSDLLC